MNTDTVSHQNPEDLLDQLQVLLEQQAVMVKNSNLRGLEALVEQAGSVVAELTKTQLSQPSQWKDKYERLIQLYKKLELMIEAEKDSVNRQLLKVGSGKKTVQAYLNKI